MTKASAKKTEEESLKEYHDFRHARLTAAHAIAVKQFGADVSPKISSRIFDYLSEDEDANDRFALHLAEAATRAVATFGENGKDPENAFIAFEDIYTGGDDE